MTLRHATARLALLLCLSAPHAADANQDATYYVGPRPLTAMQSAERNIPTDTIYWTIKHALGTGTVLAAIAAPTCLWIGKWRQWRVIRAYFPYQEPFRRSPWLGVPLFAPDDTLSPRFLADYHAAKKPWQALGFQLAATVCLTGLLYNTLWRLFS